MKYLVTLTPTGRFFFGGDMTFPVGDVEKDKKSTDKKAGERNAHNETFASYIISSSKVPQQTSLLGVLRFLILSHHKEAFDGKMQKIINRQNAKALIGVHGFMIDEKHKEKNDFGFIHSIGTCFLRQGDTEYWPAPLDYDLTVENFESISDAKLNGKPLCIPKMKKGGKAYTSKDGLCSKYISELEDVLEENDIYEEDVRIGIRRNENGKTDDNAFYKQIGYRLTEGFQFAFIVDTDEDLKSYGKQPVSVGADNSIFIFEAFEEVGEPKWPTISDIISDMPWQRIVLLSDTYLESSDLECVKYAITTVKPFRFIKSTINDVTYDMVHNLHQRSERYNLYAAGSVFFVASENAAAFRECVESKMEFVQIGYNNCKYLNLKKNGK